MIRAGRFETFFRPCYFELRPKPGRFLARPRKPAQRRAPRGNHVTLRSVGFGISLKLVRSGYFDSRFRTSDRQRSFTLTLGRGAEIPEGVQQSEYNFLVGAAVIRSWNVEGVADIPTLYTFSGFPDQGSSAQFVRSHPLPCRSDRGTFRSPVQGISPPVPSGWSFPRDCCPGACCN